MSFSVYNDATASALNATVALLQTVGPAIVSGSIDGTTGEINAVTAGDITTLSLASPITNLDTLNLLVPIGGAFQFKGGIQVPVANYVLTCMDANGTVEWAPGGTSGSPFTNITVTNQANFNLMDFQYNTTNILQNQVLATDNTATKNVISIPYTSANTATTLVERDGSGNFSAGTVTFANVIDSGLTASQAVVTNGSKQLTSLAYTSANTASTLVERDASGNFSAGTISGNFSGGTVTTTNFVLSTGANNGYVLTSNAGGTAAWAAPTGVTSIAGTANQITASAATGNVTLSLPATVDVTTLNVSSLTASQAVVTDGSKNLTSLGYTSANTVSTLVERDGSGNFSAGTITTTGISTTGFALTTTPTNGYFLTSNAGGTASWTAGVNSITGTPLQITASASTGGVTLSFPSTINNANITVNNGGTLTAGGTTGSGSNFIYNGYSLQDPNTATTGQVLTRSGTTSMTWANYISSGTFVPVLKFGSNTGTVGITYSNQQGFYTVCGSTGNGFVTAFINIQLTSKGTSTGTAYVDALPYTYRIQTFGQVFSAVDSNNITFGTSGTGFIGSFASPSGFTGPGLLTFFNQASGGGGVPLDNTNFVNASALYLTGTYLI